VRCRTISGLALRERLSVDRLGSVVSDGFDMVR
jgi:hypothetical protein